ncbi:MAG: alpha/beta hydrolase [Clostridia bacterium]|nr:alpha/beta hydrolase [Clostridia bacterium]
MEKKINGLNIHYQVMGEGKDLLLLHGWGADRSVMAPMQKHFSQLARVISLDLPGFGQSEAPPTAWGIYDYADFVAHFLAELGLYRPVILGHSFGGRIAIILGSRGLAGRLILVDSAGLVPKRGARYYARVYSYKLAKKIFSLPGLKKAAPKVLNLWLKSNPSSDYRAAEGVMRQVFVRVVNEDLRKLLPQIAVSTLLIWGEDDAATPLADGQLMEELIPDAGLAVLPHCGHFSFVDDSARFYAVVDYFLTHP